MSVHDFDITAIDANTGIAMRAAINAALQALAGQNSGATDPAITYPYQVRVDTSASPAVVYWRKSDNSAWARVGYVNSSGILVLDKLGDVVSKTAAYTATVNDYMLLCDATTAAWTLTLPSAAAGKEYVVKKTDSSVNAITVDPNGAETIDGAATASLSVQNQILIIISDGTNWRKKSALEFIKAYGQAYRTATFNFAATNTWYDIPLNAGNNNLKNVSHSTSTNPERVTVSVSGTYRISYRIATHVAVTQYHVKARLVKNAGDTEIPGSASSVSAGGGASSSFDDPAGGSVIVSLSANDYIKIQAGSGSTTMELNIYDDAALPDFASPTTAIMVIEKIDE